MPWNVKCKTRLKSVFTEKKRIISSVLCGFFKVYEFLAILTQIKSENRYKNENIGFDSQFFREKAISLHIILYG